MHISHHRLQPTPDIQIVAPSSLNARLFFEQTRNQPDSSSFAVVSDPRTTRIKFSALFQALYDAFNEECELLEWIAEGSRNQLYLAHLTSGRQVAARITFPYNYATMNNGPEFFVLDEVDWSLNPARMKSEVETMKYLKRMSNIPLPSIFSFNFTESPVGAPYIFEELAGGTTLEYQWGKMSREQKTIAIQRFGRICGRLYALEFDSYGSICDSVAGTIGPLVDPLYSLHRIYPLEMRGPWPKDNPFGVFTALAVREHSWLESDMGKRLFVTRYEPGRDGPDISPEQAWTSRLRLTKELISLIPHLHALYPLPALALRPTLAHPDYNFRNVMVSDSDPTLVTGVLDWEYTAVLPLWYTHSMIQDIEYVGEQVYENPLYSKEEEDMLRDVYTKAITETFPNFKSFIYDEELQRKVKALNAIMEIVAKGALLGHPMWLFKTMLEYSRKEADLGDESGIAILDDVIKLVSL